MSFKIIAFSLNIRIKFALFLLSIMPFKIDIKNFISKLVLLLHLHIAFKIVDVFNKLETCVLVLIFILKSISKTFVRSCSHICLADEKKLFHFTTESHLNNKLTLLFGVHQPNTCIDMN